MVEGHYKSESNALAKVVGTRGYISHKCMLFKERCTRGIDLVVARSTKRGVPCVIDEL